MIAVTNISHGKGGGETIWIAAGSEVNEKLFTKEEFQTLKDNGSVVDVAKLEDVASLQKQVADLQAKIDILQSDAATAGRTAGPFLEQTAADPLAGVPGSTTPEDKPAAPVRKAAPKQDK